MSVGVMKDYSGLRETCPSFSPFRFRFLPLSGTPF
jgi:hypothetical protein